jgi:hypothetical protein
VVRGQRLAGWLCLLVAVVGAFMFFTMRDTASATSRGYLRINLGQGFTTAPRGPLIDMTQLAPGLSTSAVMGVHNGFRSTSALYLAFDNVVEHGAAGSARSLLDELRINISLGASRSARYTQVWSGSMRQLAHAVAIDDAVRAGTDQWVRVTAALPMTVGDEVESSVIGFGIHVQLDSASGSDGVEVGSQRHHSGLGGLASTGVSVVLLTIGAMLLIGCGVILLWSGRTDRRSA